MRPCEGAISRTIATRPLSGNDAVTSMPQAVSVIIPTYNRVDLIGRALRSVYAQSVPPCEVIVVDDGSTDGTGSFVNDRFPDALYVKTDQRGVSAARNAGIMHSRGEWLAFLDSDDQWLPHKLEVQLRQLQGHTSMRICHTEEIWIRNGRRVNPARKHAKKGGWIFHACLPLCAMSPSSILIHRSVFERVGLFDEALPACEDYDLWLRITARYPVLFVDEPLILKYGGHADQLSRRHWGMDRFRIRALEKVLIAGVLDRECERAARDMLLRKARIYLEGARKRGRLDDVDHYEALCRRYSKEQMNSPETRHG